MGIYETSRPEKPIIIPSGLRISNLEVDVFLYKQIDNPSFVKELQQIGCQLRVYSQLSGHVEPPGVFCLFGEVFGVESQQSTTKTMNGPSNGYSNEKPRLPPTYRVFLGFVMLGITKKNMKVVEGTIVRQQICSPPIDHLRSFSRCIFLRSGQYGMDPFCGTVGFRWWDRCLFRVWCDFYQEKFSVIFKTCCTYM